MGWNSNLLITSVQERYSGCPGTQCVYCWLRILCFGAEVNESGLLKFPNMAEGQDLSKMDASEIDIAEDESDGQKSPTSRRKKVKKVSIVKSKKQTDKRFDWPKKSYFEILCQEGNEMVRINGC